MNAQADLEVQLLKDIAGYRSDPLGCVKYSFPWGQKQLKDYSGPREWQADILSVIGQHLRSKFRFQPIKIAIASGHGVGKSALIGMIAHWGMSTCDDCRVLCTANTEDQLATKTWPEVSKWFSMAINKDWFKPSATRICSTQPGHETKWRFDRETWSENNTEAFQGLHNLGKRIILIFDEASGIPKTVWDVAEGALTDENTEIIFLAFGNPTQNDTPFASCFGSLKHRWVTRHINSQDVPGTNKEQIARWIEDFGWDSDFVRVRVRGEFPRAGSKQFIPQDRVADARKREMPATGYKVISVDVARFGSNQTVIGMRQGAKATILDKLRGAATTETARRVIHFIIRENVRACIVDGDGIGGAVVDMIRDELPKPHSHESTWPKTPLSDWFKRNRAFTLQEFHGGAEPGDKFMYFNKRAEVWGTMREWMKTGDIPNDAEFEADLTGITYDIKRDTNQIQLERKEDMEKRGLASPDIGDMLAMTFAAFPVGETRDERVLREQEAIKDPMELHFARLRETERREKLRQPKAYWDL